MCLLRINLPNLCPNMNHFDAVDFSECHSEEVISFFWRSVYLLPWFIHIMRNKINTNILTSFVVCRKKILADLYTISFHQIHLLFELELRNKLLLIKNKNIFRIICLCSYTYSLPSKSCVQGYNSSAISKRYVLQVWYVSWAFACQKQEVLYWCFLSSFYEFKKKTFSAKGYSKSISLPV